MRKIVIGMAGFAVALSMGACTDSPLAVGNGNNPDIEKVFATPAGVESYIGTTYQQVFNGIHRNNMTPQLNALSLESYASVANFGMALRVAIPRLPIQNARGNQTYAENFADFSNMQRLAGFTARALHRFDQHLANNLTTGSPARDARARAFAFFTLGLAEGYTAMVYDSAAVADPANPPTDLNVPALSDYGTANTAALAMLDSALAIANGSAATADAASFKLPSTWINGNALTRTQFIQLIHSYKARFRAGVARNPAERAAVDWTQVVADATAGITSDLNVALSVGAGWRNTVIEQAYVYTGWHMESPFYIGMADTTGGYDAWLATPLTSRAAFLIQTPDKRFPAGATRAAQTAASNCTSTTCTGPTAGVYFRNRPSGQDTPGDAWGNSYYDHYRFYSIYLSSDKAGNWPEFTRAENDMLAAEGYIRAGNLAAAAPLIDRTRTANGGLPAVAGSPAEASLSNPVPGGAGCVPRVPQGPSFTSAACGNLLEAMKWEKRLESAFTGYVQWYTDNRGWGDLISGTPLQYPVPYQEMDARAHPFYNSGTGAEWVAAAGTYGF